MNSVQTRLSVDRRDGVLLLTLDCPERLNAVTVETLAALAAALQTADAPVVITGRGRAFSAGQDLHELAALDVHDERAVTEHLDLYQQITTIVSALAFPTVAAINGVAVGFGAELALACDMRVASPSARMGFVETRRGLFQTNGVTWLLPRLVGHGRAAHLLLTGDILDSWSLEAWGLVTVMAPEHELLTTAIGLALRAGAGDDLSLALVKAALARTWTSSLPEMMAVEVYGMRACLDAGIATAGAQAFVSTP